MIAVFDTNVLASGIRSTGVPGELLDRWRRRLFEIAWSEWIIVELRRMLGNEYFVRQDSAREREDYLTILIADVHLVQISREVRGVASHREDDLILATAVSAKADSLVTGDKPLLALGSFEGVRIVSPRDFLAILDTQQPTLPPPVWRSDYAGHGPATRTRTRPSACVVRSIMSPARQRCRRTSFGASWRCCRW